MSLSLCFAMQNQPIEAVALEYRTATQPHLIYGALAAADR